MTKEEKLGISKIKYAIDNAFDVILGLINTFGDGVQITDAIHVPGIGKDFYDIITVIDEAKEEAKDLSYAEVDEIIKSYGERTIDLIWVKNSQNLYDTRAIDKIMDLVFETYVLILEHSKDGIDIDDLDILPKVSDNILEMVRLSERAYKEIKDLSSKEVYKVGTNLSSKVLLLLKA